MNRKRFERGQALVLIVLAIVAIFGFAALAVDFGRVYAERRRVQSAADAAALAAGFAAGQGQDYVAAAKDQLILNDVFDEDFTRNTDKRVDVELYNPPVSGPYGPDSGRTDEERDQYYQVIIHSGVDQIFSQFVYQGPLQLTVEAVAHVRKSGGIFSGDVLHALTRTECTGLRFHGGAGTHLRGGNAFSDSLTNGNGDCDELPADGGESCTSAVLDGSGDVWVEDGTVNTGGSWRQAGGSGDITTAGPINECVTPQDAPYVPLPDCSGLPSQTYTGQETINAGVYADGIQVTGKKTDLKLTPGIYCLDKSFIVNGGTVTGENVMIYMRGGDFKLGGTAVVNLKAAAGEDSHYVEDASGQNWSGMLIYMPKDNTGEVQIGGGSGSQYTGTIYAPGPRDPLSKTKCTIIGSSGSIGVASNVICYSIEIGGNATVNIDYQEAATYHTPPIIDLAQ